MEKVVIDSYIVGKFYKGGGINRMKRHLAGIKGDVAARPVHGSGRVDLGPKKNST